MSNITSFRSKRRPPRVRDDHLLEMLPAAVCVCDLDGVVVRYNKRAAELWGRSPVPGDAHELYCGSHKLYMPSGEVLPHDQTPMMEAVRTGASFRNIEVQVEQPSGKRLWVMASIDPLRDDKGNVIGAINCFQDVTERRPSLESKEAEDRSRLLASVVESSDDAIITTDLDTVITSWNRAAEKIYGYSAEEIIGKPVMILLPDDRKDEETGIIERIRRGERIEHYESTRRRKDGNSVDISLSVSPIKDADGNVIGASKIARDVTERKRAEYLVATLAREAEHRTKNIFATVEATIRLSNGETSNQLKQAIQGRIRALSNVHGLFVKSRWAGADVGSIVAQEISAFRKGNENQVFVSGPHLEMTTAAAQTLAVAIHELATNAAKYGALSISQGRLRVEWSETSDGRLDLVWTEMNGPEIKPPSTTGFGTDVMHRLIAAQRGGIDFDWNPAGLICRLTIEK